MPSTRTSRAKSPEATPSTLAPSPQAPSTRSAWADERLRLAIIEGELAPGAKLVVSSLAARWGVSQTPLRDAVRRLAGEGLIDLVPHGPAIVAKLSHEDVAEVYELRRKLEPDALRQSMESGGDAHRDAVHAAFERISVPGLSPKELIDAHADFHSALLGCARSQWLLRLIGTLSDHARRWHHRIATAAEGAGLALQHRELHDLVLRGDTDAACDELDRHLEGGFAAIQLLAGASFEASAPKRP